MMKTVYTILLTMFISATCIASGYEQDTSAVYNPINSLASNKRVANVQNRQSLITANIDSTGQPIYLGYSSGKITVYGSNTALKATVADGFNDYGQIDYILSLKSDISITPESSTYPQYIYLTYNVNTGSIGLALTDISPITADSFESSPTEGQLLFHNQLQKMYIYRRGVWEASPALILGEFDGTSIRYYLSPSNITFTPQVVFSATWVQGTTQTWTVNMTTGTYELTLSGVSTGQLAYRCNSDSGNNYYGSNAVHNASGGTNFSGYNSNDAYIAPNDSEGIMFTHKIILGGPRNKFMTTCHGTMVSANNDIICGTQWSGGAYPSTLTIYVRDSGTFSGSLRLMKVNN